MHGREQAGILFEGCIAWHQRWDVMALTAGAYGTFAPGIALRDF